MPPFIEVLSRRLSARAEESIELPLGGQAAVALILAPDADGRTHELLLIERALRAGDPWSGHMALPGGRRAPTDVDLRATAVRETREETGVDLRGARFLGRLDDVHPIRQPDRSLVVRPFVYSAATRPELSLGDEVTGVHWASFARLREVAGEANVEYRGTKLRVPSYAIDGRIVWGMTQRVIASLLELE